MSIPVVEPGFFAQRTNLLRSGHLGLFKEILRFNRTASRLLAEPQHENVTLGEFIERGRFGAAFRDFYLYPMASAVWSTSLAKMEEFPAATLIRFFDNHGMLGVNSHPQWKVLRGGSSSYVPQLTAPLGRRLFLEAKITAVEREETGVQVKFADKTPVWFDHVVFACHGNQVLPLLERPSETERDILRHFQTSRNDTVLHTDDSLLPTNLRARASWNYHLNGDRSAGVTMTYDMNRLQSLVTREKFCVTLNANGQLDRDKVIRQMTYFHPLYTREAIRAQTRWNEISGKKRTHFCGAYWFYGFHEDGLNSAMRVARALGVDC